MPTVTTMVLQEILPNYGCPTLMALARGVGVRKQYAWLLWHGKIALSVDMLRRIHEAFDVPVEVLLQVTRATPPKRRGRKPAQPPTEAGRDDRCWHEGNLTLEDSEEEQP